MVMDYENVAIERDGAIAWVRLNRPAKLNALSSELQRELIETFVDLDADDTVRVICLGSTSRRAFCAGADLREAPQRASIDPMRSPGRNLYETVFDCSTPTLAVLPGWVIGGGMELAMACDMRIANTDAKFQMPEGRVGMAANFGSQMLPRLLGWAHAFEILYLGEPFDAERAQNIGLVSEVVPPDSLESRASELARTIASRAPLSLRRFKAMIQRGSAMPVNAALRLDPGPSPYLSVDREEGARAFREHREPRWTGK